MHRAGDCPAGLRRRQLIKRFDGTLDKPVLLGGSLSGLDGTTFDADGISRPNGLGFCALSRDSRVGQRIAVSFCIQFCDCTMNGSIKIIRVGESLMGEIVGLEIQPDAFDHFRAGDAKHRREEL